MAFDTEQSNPAERSAQVAGRVLSWLTAGYPDGIPPTDRFAVIALLKRRLTDDDIREIYAELTEHGSPARADDGISRAEVEQLIGKVLQEQPSDDDIRRVSAHLAAGGWPLAGSSGPDTEIDEQRGSA